jgi:putative oxidoreductase
MSAAGLGLLVLRVVAGGVFAAHGAQKAFGWWSGPGFAGWRSVLERTGIRPATFWAMVSTAAELVGGVLLVIGLLTPLAAAALVGQALVMIFQVHLPKGFWVSKGGIEYALTLGAVALSLVVMGGGELALDHVAGLAYPVAVRAGLLVLGVIGAGIALALPRLSTASAQATPQR